MINIGKILKRAWQIFWNYKVLWIFGFLFAITGGNGGGNPRSGNNGYQFSGNNGYRGITPSTNPNVQQLNQWFLQNIEPLFRYPLQHLATWIWIGVAFLLFILMVSIIFALIRYPTETAILRMVDEYEKTGEKVGFRKGWSFGWNRRAFRLWVIDLIVSLPTLLLVLLFGGLGIIVYLSVKNGSTSAITTSIIAGVGCAILFFIIFLALLVVLGLLRQFFIRAAALDDNGIGDSFRNGWKLFRRQWKGAALMWLVMVGIGIGVGIIGLIVFFLLIPAYLVLLVPAAIISAIPGLIVFGVTSIFTTGPLNWILGILAGLPFFLLVVFAPLAFLSGWYLIYKSSVWTLTYRELKALEGIESPVESTVIS